MNLQQTLQDYLIMRRGLGFKLISDGKALKTFVSFLELHQQDIITTKFALSWAKQSTTVQSSRWARRLSIVRSFSRYCRAIEPSSEVPPQDLLPFNYRRPRPHLFMDSDIKKLLQASQQISGNDYFKQTLHCLFGLLSVTGLRISEALDLTVDDVDLETGVLTVRNTKFGKSRLIPLHNTTVSVLVKYCEQREIFLAGQQFAYWFLNQHKERLGYACVRYQFNKLLKSIATEVQEGDRIPHLHDLRHYFARSVLVNWYRDGQDVERCLPKLSAYLGHVETRDTYWYLSVCPELMGAVQVLLEQRWGKRS